MDFIQRKIQTHNNLVFQHDLAFQKGDYKRAKNLSKRALALNEEINALIGERADYHNDAHAEQQKRLEATATKPVPKTENRFIHAFKTILLWLTTLRQRNATNGAKKG